MRTNRPNVSVPVLTHEGAPAVRITPLKELRRSVLSALLFEDTFYEKGSAHADRVRELIKSCRPADVAALAIEARDRMYLRHVPLFLVRELARVPGNGSLVADTLEAVIQRPDELTEYLAMYWAQGRCPLSAGSKRGLTRAFRKFDASTLAKYNRADAVKLRDVLRITHPNPLGSERSEIWRKVVKGELESPDTWEVQLSSGANKKDTFERLLREKKLGGLAFLRNLRNMIQAGVSNDLIRERFQGGFAKVLPFRFVAAKQYAPGFVRDMDQAMQKCLEGLPRLPGRTGVLVDVSGSMDATLSAKSQMNRIDAAGGLAVLVSALAEYPRIFTFSERTIEVPAYAGLALIDTIHRSQAHSSTYLGAAVTALNRERFDRIIVITDEQSHDIVPTPTARGYMINVSTAKNGVGYGKGWVNISGFSERILDFVREYEVGAFD